MCAAGNFALTPSLRGARTTRNFCRKLQLAAKVFIGGGMSSKKIALSLSVFCALTFAFFPVSCTVKSTEKTAQEATDALAMPFAPIDFDKAEAANEGVPQKKAEEQNQ